MLKINSKSIQTILIILAVVLFIWFVWPTLYLYDQIKIGTNILPVRINRITENTDILYPSGWSHIDRTTEKTAISEQPIELPESELHKLEIEPKFQYGFIKASVYNPTDWIVEELKVRIIVTNPLGNFDPNNAVPLNEKSTIHDPLGILTKRQPKLSSKYSDLISGDTVLSREYLLTRENPSIGGKPFSSSIFTAQVDFDPKEQFVSCTILQAKGKKEITSN